MRKKVTNHDILIVLIDINPFFHILTLVTVSNSKFGCFLFFSCNFPAKKCANVLFFVRVLFFVNVLVL